MGNRRRRFGVRLLLGLTVVVAFLFVFVFPARSLLDQRHQENKARNVLNLLHAQNDRLQHDSKVLDSDAEIERIAREQYGLVFPGEQPYIVVPPSSTPPTTPAP